MVNVKARCKCKVWSFKLKTVFPNPGRFAPMVWIRGEITGDFCPNRYNPMNTHAQPPRTWPPLDCNIWTFYYLGKTLITILLVTVILRPSAVLPTYVNFHLGWKAERGHWSLVSLSSSLWLSLFPFSLPLSLSFFPFCSATEQQKRWKA